MIDTFGRPVFGRAAIFFVPDSRMWWVSAGIVGAPRGSCRRLDTVHCLELMTWVWPRRARGVRRCRGITEC